MTDGRFTVFVDHDPEAALELTFVVPMEGATVVPRLVNELEAIRRAFEPVVDDRLPFFADRDAGCVRLPSVWQDADDAEAARSVRLELDSEWTIFSQVESDTVALRQLGEVGHVVIELSSEELHRGL